MIIILVINLFCVFANEYIYSRIPSSLFKNDKFYYFFPTELGQEYPTFSVYNLQDGPISQLRSTVVNIPNAPDGYMAQFLNFDQDFQNELSNDIWMMNGYYVSSITDDKLDSSKWTAKLLNDNQLSFGSNSIKFPNYPNFPKGGFSQNIVNVNNNPAMYVIGGYTYSEKLNSRVITNCVFKYDFNSNSWSDLSEESKSILPPIANHHTVQLNNILIVINGVSPKTIDNKYPQTYSINNPTKLNSINKVYKLDLSTEKWDVIPIKTNLDSSRYGDGNMLGASYNSYNGNLITYGSVETLSSGLGDVHFGTLDLTSFEWRWNPIKTDSGIDNSLSLSFHQSLIIRDQLLLFKGATNQRNLQEVYAINLKDHKFQANLDYTGESSALDGRPMYINLFIGLGAALGCILLIILLLLFIRYRKKKLRDSKNNKQIEAVWATSANSASSHALVGMKIDYSYESDIFSLENIHTFEDKKYKSNELEEDLMQLTLTGSKLDTKSKTSNSTNISDKYSHQ